MYFINSLLTKYICIIIKLVHESTESNYIQLNFQLKLSSFNSWIKFNKLIIKSSFKQLSNWFGSLSVLHAVLLVLLVWCTWLIWRLTKKNQHRLLKKKSASYMVLNYPSMHIAQLIELKVPYKKTRMLLINANFLVLFFFLQQINR